MASVYLKRIETIAQGSSATRGQVLGHAAAHEIGHLLLGTLEHSPHGIMKADWKGRTLEGIARRGMVFSTRQAEHMRTRIRERQRRANKLQSAGLR